MSEIHIFREQYKVKIKNIRMILCIFYHVVFRNNLLATIHRVVYRCIISMDSN